MAGESLADYPEVPGMEEELLELSQALLRNPARNKQELLKAMALYYAAKSGLEVTPSTHDPYSMMGAEQAVVFALKDSLNVYTDMLSNGARMSPAEYQELVDVLSENIPRVFAAQAIPSYIFDAVVRRHKDTRYLGMFHQAPTIPPDAADVEDTIRNLLALLPPGALRENSMAGFEDSSG
eukprot:TRINITY_DN30133_c0_g1_i1.p2 TRINITY_DN30133_c0_g1~~TRINITY_DN30133_c0_g1_i1.p2  ORF type:complete len:180 (+),score=58.06 TRINITY_DN30133_c0_g1_i1:69-608(+)